MPIETAGLTLLGEAQILLIWGLEPFTSMFPFYEQANGQTL